MSIPTNQIPENYRLLSITGDEYEKPKHIFNVEDLLSGFCNKLWRVETACGYTPYFDYVVALNEQEALDILADAVEDTEQRDHSGAILRQLRDKRPWFGHNFVPDADADKEREEEGSYSYLGNSGLRFDLENVAIRPVPYKINIELLPVSYI